MESKRSVLCQRRLDIEKKNVPPGYSFEIEGDIVKIGKDGTILEFEIPYGYPFKCPKVLNREFELSDWSPQQHIIELFDTIVNFENQLNAKKRKLVEDYGPCEIVCYKIKTGTNGSKLTAHMNLSIKIKE